MILESPVYQLIAPEGTHIEVVGRERAQTLLSRPGYRKQNTPEPPPSPLMGEPIGVHITASVVHAPWAEDRARNIQSYGIPDLAVVSDDERQGCWATVKRAWKYGAKAGGTHHLMLTDDLTLPLGFWDALNEVVRIHPRSPISLLSVRPGAKLAYESGYRWCISWGVTGAATVLPVGMIEPFLVWDESNVKPDCPHDDVRLTGWCSDHGIGVLTPVPCLVNHGDFPGIIEDSTVFGQHHARAMAWQDDVRGVDWSFGADDPCFIGISVDRPGKWMKDGRTLEDVRGGP